MDLAHFMPSCEHTSMLILLLLNPPQEVVPSTQHELGATWLIFRQFDTTS